MENNGTVIKDNGVSYSKVSNEMMENRAMLYVEDGGEQIQIDSGDVLKRNPNNLGEKPSRLDLLKEALSLPPHGSFAQLLTWLLIFGLVWCSFISITGDSSLPGGHLFSLIIIFLLSSIAGHLVSMAKLPPLLGMLMLGIGMRSCSSFDIITDNIDPTLSAVLRNTALVILLVRAGLGLDPQKLKKLSGMVFKLAIIPCIIEALTIAVISHLIMGFPWLWGLLLGCMISAVSPAVVVPCLLSIRDKGLGVDKGIPTLAIAAGSVDNVIAISGFGVMLGLVFSTGGSLVWKIFQGPVEVLIGLVFGLVAGTVSWYLPYQHHTKVSLQRFIVIFTAGIMALFGSKMIKCGGAGALGVLTTAFVANVGWRRQDTSEQKNPVSEYFNMMWELVQPVLFCIVGSEIQISSLEPTTIMWGLLVLGLGLIVRLAASFFSVMGDTFTVKERIFLSIARFPKATVQAVLGPMALDLARTAMDGELTGYATQVLTIAVLAIVVTAPLGAAAISLSAPSLLAQKRNINQEMTGV